MGHLHFVHTCTSVSSFLLMISRVSWILVRVICAVHESKVISWLVI